ncbi:hypothetical protein [Isoptericola sp. b408]|uniref:hypothetical protein n=1 Tax=Isoptericola sp. b408 TaxID=3064653 RepID=UPI0027130C22|nr:hypothetical protein [Isoptericola sp. b408]MDO8150197.1 hypothetical protein [Isoptericola sp. b408]
MAGNTTHVALDSLRLDERNPRLPEELHGSPQLALAKHLAAVADALQIAESIVDNGFFGTEHIVVTPDPQDPDAFVVLEGNRRVTALLGLSSAEVRAEFDQPARWHAIGPESGISPTSLVPAVVVPNREEAAPMIGFRHFTGIKKWGPFEQARYVKYLVEEEGMTIRAAAKAMGSSSVKVGNAYRNHEILEQAKSLPGVSADLLARARKDFSLITVAMANGALREHVGAPLASQIQVGQPPVPADRADELAELMGWIYGADESTPRVVTESREIGALAEVVADPAGRNALRENKDLGRAKQAMHDARDAKNGDEVLAVGRQITSSVKILGSLESRLRAMPDADRAQVRNEAHQLLELAQRISGIVEHSVQQR